MPWAGPAPLDTRLRRTAASALLVMTALLGARAAGAAQVALPPSQTWAGQGDEPVLWRPVDPAAKLPDGVARLRLTQRGRLDLALWVRTREDAAGGGRGAGVSVRDDLLTIDGGDGEPPLAPPARALSGPRSASPAPRAPPPLLGP